MYSEDQVIFQCAFGLKQARPGHSSPVIRLHKAPDEELCPVQHVQAYLQRTEALHSSDALFIITVPPHGAAARVTLWQWFSSVLSGAGVDASPGSSCSAVASLGLAEILLY